MGVRLAINPGIMNRLIAKTAACNLKLRGSKTSATFPKSLTSRIPLGAKSAFFN